MDYKDFQNRTTKQNVRLWCEHALKNFIEKNRQALPERHELEHVIDYFNAVTDEKKNLNGFSVKDALKKSKRWNENQNNINKKIKEKDEDVKVLLKFKDGFSIVLLKTEEAYKKEGSLMNHCVATYYATASENLSLRDSKNKPHCTIEFIKSENYVNQIKGNSNAPVKKEYQKYVYKFLEYYNLHLNANEFKNLNIIKISDTIVKDLSDFLNFKKVSFQNVIAVNLNDIEIRKNLSFKNQEFLEESSIFLYDYLKFLIREKESKKIENFINSPLIGAINKKQLNNIILEIGENLLLFSLFIKSDFIDFDIKRKIIIPVAFIKKNESFIFFLMQEGFLDPVDHQDKIIKMSLSKDSNNLERILKSNNQNMKNVVAKNWKRMVKNALAIANYYSLDLLFAWSQNNKENIRKILESTSQDRIEFLNGVPKYSSFELLIIDAISSKELIEYENNKSDKDKLELILFSIFNKDYKLYEFTLKKYIYFLKNQEDIVESYLSHCGNDPVLYSLSLTLGILDETFIWKVINRDDITFYCLLITTNFEIFKSYINSDLIPFFIERNKQDFLYVTENVLKQRES